MKTNADVLLQIDILIEMFERYINKKITKEQLIAWINYLNDPTNFN